MFRYIAAVTLSLLGVLPTLAASEDAWAQFATKVEESCVAAAGGLLENPVAVVDPFGSENFGLAIVTGAVAIGRPVSVICVFDKLTEGVQIGGELDVTVTAND